MATKTDKQRRTKNAACGRGCGHSGKIIILHLLIAVVPGRISGWFNEGVLILASWRLFNGRLMYTRALPNCITVEILTMHNVGPPISLCIVRLYARLYL
jgi:hypothetical protein